MTTPATQGEREERLRAAAPEPPTADLADTLRAWASLVSSGYEVPAAGTVMHGAADRLEALDAMATAAPDLLTACKALLELHIAHHNHPVHVTARAAIAKAERKE